MITIELYWCNGLSYRIWRNNELRPYSVGQVKTTQELDHVLSQGKIGDGYNAVEARRLLTRRNHA